MCISNVKKGMKFIMNYYEILEVPYDASFSNIKSSYLRLAKKNYPDMFSQQDDGERMKQLNEAYAVLKNKKKRALYDRWLSDEFVKASKLLKDNLNDNMDEKFESKGENRKIYSDKVEILLQDIDIEASYLRQLLVKAERVIKGMENLELKAFNNLDSCINDIDNSILRLFINLQIKAISCGAVYKFDKMFELEKEAKVVLAKLKLYSAFNINLLSEFLNESSISLQKINKIKQLIIKYPENKKIINLCKYANRLYNDYIIRWNKNIYSLTSYRHYKLIYDKMDEVKKINKDCNQILKANYMQNLSKLKELRQNGYGVSNLRFLLSASIGSIALIDAVTIPLFMNNGVVLFVNIGGLLIMLLVFRKLVTSNNYDVIDYINRVKNYKN